MIVRTTARVAVSLGVFLFFIAYCGIASADDVRLHYDRSGNIVAIQEAAATALAVEDVRPGFGTPGDMVTIVGSGFGSSTTTNTVGFNGTAASVVTVSSNALTTTVPQNAKSGPVAVTAGSVTVSSPNNFIVLPSGISSASVSNATSLTLDGNALDVATVGSRSAAVSFVITQGIYASIQFITFSGTTTSSAPYSVYKPDGTLFKSGTVSTTTPTILLPLTPSSGVYTLFLTPQGWLKTRITLTSDPNWGVNGPGLTLTSVPYQQRRAWFTGTAAQNLTYAYTNLTLVPITATGPQINFYKPDGTALSSLISLPATGTYAVVITPASNATSTSLQLWLSPEITGTLNLNTPTPLSASRPGQHARYTFQGTQGQYLRLAANATSTANPANQRVGLSIYNPSGSTLVDTDVATSSGNQTYSVPVLPATGTYTLFVGIDIFDNQNATWNTTVTLSSDPTATITIDGPSTDLGTTLLGQQVRATFSATAGQNLGFAYTNLTLTPSNPGIPAFAFYKPDGTVLSSLINLPVTGTYTLVITPSANTTASSMSLWLSSDVTGALDLNTPTPLSVSRPGQHARYTFQGTQGQVLKFTATSTSTNPANQLVVINGYNPNGSALISSGYFNAISGTAATYTTSALTATGTYTVYIAINPNSNTNSTWATTLTVSPQ